MNEMTREGFGNSDSTSSEKGATYRPSSRHHNASYDAELCCRPVSSTKARRLDATERFLVVEVGLHSLAFPALVSFLAHSFITFRCIFPAGLFGIVSTNTTPPVKYLYLATLSSIQVCMSFAVVLLFSLSCT